MAVTSPSPPMLESMLPSLQRIHQGKVRDIYAVDTEHMLIVTTDRLSAFDVVLPQPIPGKGSILTRISQFWFERTRHIVPNHLTNISLESVVRDERERAVIADRSMIVRKLKALPIEAVVRGYLIGSGWKDYQQTGMVCGIELPRGLELASRLPQPLFTPATKAEIGAHDENISYDRVRTILGQGLAEQVRATALALYAYAYEYALARGIIIADTKFEFGVDDAGRLTLIDEVLTPDSSRFWDAERWRPGGAQASYDKQFVRDYLETLTEWKKTPPAPPLPAEVIEKTQAKYFEAIERLTGEKLKVE